jgi:hypothetical protein
MEPFRERGQQPVFTLLEGMHQLLGCAVAASLLLPSYCNRRAGIGRGVTVGVS